MKSAHTKKGFVKTSLVTSLVLAVLGMTLGGCGWIKHSSPNFIYMPDMVYSPAIKAGEPEAIRAPVAGTVPRGFQPYPYGKDEIAKAGDLRNPLRRTQAVLERGQKMYNTYCIVCHGPTGLGNGSVVPKYPAPPSLQSDKIREYPDGKIYHVITRGQNLMWSYANQVDPTDRWAIIHYIRVLQRAAKPTAEDLKALEGV